MGRFVDRVGHRFGRLVVAERGENIGKKVGWICRCDCGAATVVAASNLVTGHTTSCGCLQREGQSVRITERNTVHGHNRAGAGNQSPTWHSWTSMRKRCNQESHVSYADYGGRGISVCARWDDFTNFLADMGERPEGRTLDRIDVNGNYEPDNCRWATLSEQARNTRRAAQ